MRVTLSNSNNSVFLVQRKQSNEDFASLMDSFSLIEYLNFKDIYCEDYDIWQVDEFGIVSHCHYVGWQPNCRIQVIRDCDNEVVVDDYGEDH